MLAALRTPAAESGDSGSIPWLNRYSSTPRKGASIRPTTLPENARSLVCGRRRLSGRSSASAAVGIKRQSHSYTPDRSGTTVVTRLFGENSSVSPGRATNVDRGVRTSIVPRRGISTVVQADSISLISCPVDCTRNNLLPDSSAHRTARRGTLAGVNAKYCSSVNMRRRSKGN